MSPKEKKMPKSNTDLAGRKYFPAVLKHLAVGWQIDYYVQHPQTGEMVRQRMKLNRMRARYHTTAQFRVAAMEIVTNINVRLAGGWTPYFDAENVRYYTRLPEVISLYLSEKERELRPATYSTYKNWCDTFLSWCKDNRIADTYASLVNRVTAVSFTDYLYNSHHLSARSYNNMVKQGRAFFNWCKEKCYVKDNPFEQIAKKREQPKRRILVPAQERLKITEHLRETNSAFLIVCELVYSSLIRPNEIRHLKIKYLHLSDLYIEIPADIAKNHHARSSAIKPATADLLEKHTAGCSSKKDWYLFSADMKPGSKPCDGAKFRHLWEKMRKHLKLDDNMQLYSLRDTGINEMLKCGIDPLTVMQHADHHDLTMTTRYANHADPGLIRKIVDNAPDF